MLEKSVLNQRSSLIEAMRNISALKKELSILSQAVKRCVHIHVLYIMYALYMCVMQMFFILRGHEPYLHLLYM